MCCDPLFFLTPLIPGVAFDYLDAPIIRVTGADVPMPYAQELEQDATPLPVNVVKTVKRMLNMQ